MDVCELHLLWKITNKVNSTLLVRFEKKADNYLALVQFACAVIVWGKCALVHK